MKLTAETTTQLSKIAIATTLFSNLIGGHLTASYILFEPNGVTMQFFMQIVIGALLANLLCFMMCFVFVLANIPEKVKLLKAMLCMLINIPIAFVFVALLISYSK